MLPLISEESDQRITLIKNVLFIFWLENWCLQHSVWFFWVQIRELKCMTTMSVHHYDYLVGSVNQCPVYHAGYLGHNRVWDQPANASQHHQHHDLTSNHALFIFCHFTIALPCFLDIICWIIPKFWHTRKTDECISGMDWDWDRVMYRALLQC